MTTVRPVVARPLAPRFAEPLGQWALLARAQQALTALIEGRAIVRHLGDLHRFIDALELQIRLAGQAPVEREHQPWLAMALAHALHLPQSRPHTPQRETNLQNLEYFRARLSAALSSEPVDPEQLAATICPTISRMQAWLQAHWLD